MHERRKFHRRYLAIYSRVFDLASGRVLGYLADLSLKGIMIISDDQLPVNKIFTLRFALPDYPGFSTDHLDLQARVAWCHADVDPAFQDIGFEFSKTSAQDIGIIEEMIVTYDFNRDASDLPITNNFRSEE